MTDIFELSYITRNSGTQNEDRLSTILQDYVILEDITDLNSNLSKYAYQLSNLIPSDILNQALGIIEKIQYYPLILTFDRGIFESMDPSVLRNVISEKFGIVVDTVGIEYTDARVSFIPIRNNWKMYFPQDLIRKIERSIDINDYTGYKLLSTDDLVIYAVGTYSTLNLGIDSFKKVGNLYLIKADNIRPNYIEEINEYIESLRQEGYISIRRSEDKHGIAQEIAKIWNGEIILVCDDVTVIKNNFDFNMDVKNWYLQSVNRIIGGYLPRVFIPISRFNLKDLTTTQIIYIGYLLNKSRRVEIISSDLAIGEFFSSEDYNEFIAELDNINMDTEGTEGTLNFWYEQVYREEEANSIYMGSMYSVGNFQYGSTTSTISDMQPTEEENFEEIFELINITLSSVKSATDSAYIIEVEVDVKDVLFPDIFIPDNFINPFANKTSTFIREVYTYTLYESPEEGGVTMETLEELCRSFAESYINGSNLSLWSKYIYLKYNKISKMIVLSSI